MFLTFFCRMTDYDIKNYLEKLYNIPVLTVRSHLEKGTLFLINQLQCLQNYCIYKKIMKANSKLN